MHQQSSRASLLTERNPFLSTPGRPPRPDRALRKERPDPPFWTVRRRLRQLAIRVIDRGWFGYVPLDTHLVICGFPRSGTTLLHLMVQTAVPEARSFLQERNGFGVAQSHWPGRARYLITKRPYDIFWIDEIRELYAALGTRTQPRFVICVRDPRAVLTSRHEANRAEYRISADRWRSIHAHYQYATRYDDMCVVEFADLVLRPSAVQQRLNDLVGWTPSYDFEEFHRRVPQNFDTRPLNGVRDLDPTTLDRWKQPEHAERIKQLLREMPELPARLIEMGYEEDDRCALAYR
jgi:hypothetical protein